MKNAFRITAKLIVVIVIAFAIIAGVAAFVIRDTAGPNDPEAPMQTTAPSTPDPVKENSGTTGDATPSTNGTDPDGNNSLLSQ